MRKRCLPLGLVEESEDRSAKISTGGMGGKGKGRGSLEKNIRGREGERNQMRFQEAVGVLRI